MKPIMFPVLFFNLILYSHLVLIDIHVTAVLLFSLLLAAYVADHIRAHRPLPWITWHCQTFSILLDAAPNTALPYSPFRALVILL